MTTDIRWALGWITSGGKEYPKIEDAGAWLFFFAKADALAARDDPRQDMQRVRITVEVDYPKRPKAKRKP